MCDIMTFFDRLDIYLAYKVSIDIPSKGQKTSVCSVVLHRQNDLLDVTTKLREHILFPGFVFGTSETNAVLGQSLPIGVIGSSIVTGP